MNYSRKGKREKDRERAKGRGWTDRIVVIIEREEGGGSVSDESNNFVV